LSAWTHNFWILSVAWVWRHSLIRSGISVEYYCALNLLSFGRAAGTRKPICVPGGHYHEFRRQCVVPSRAQFLRERARLKDHQ
jgi:hypothetical protein